MRMGKMWDTGLGIVMTILAVLIVCGTLRLVSYTVLKLGGAAVMIGILSLAYMIIRKRN